MSKTYGMILAIGALVLLALPYSPAQADSADGVVEMQDPDTGGPREIIGGVRDAHLEKQKNPEEERLLRRQGIPDTDFGDDGDS